MFKREQTCLLVAREKIWEQESKVYNRVDPQ